MPKFMLWARLRRFFHCLHQIMPWRLRHTLRGDLHCALTYSNGWQTHTVACVCGRIFATRDPEVAEPWIREFAIYWELRNKER